MVARRGRQARRVGPLEALQALDQRLSNALFGRGGGVPRATWRLLELGGDGLVWLAVALGCVLAPGTPAALRAAWANFLCCWALDLVLVGLLKAAFRRSRPVYNLASDFTVVVAVDHFSFPSGHSSRWAGLRGCSGGVVQAAKQGLLLERAIEGGRRSSTGC